MFPTTSQILNNYLLQLVALILMLVVGIGLLIRFIRARSPEARKEGSYPANWAFIGVALVIAFVVCYFSLPALVNAFRYRFDPQQITEIRVTKLSDPSSANTKKAEPVVITDRELIAKGFQTLTTAAGYGANHERLLPDGYGIDFKLAGSNDYSPMHLIAYRMSRKAGESTTTTPVSVIAVSTYQEAADITFNCPAFHTWLRKNVDPLFAPPPINLPPMANSTPQN
ncbi:MAG: hypothetical protein JST85_08135 [Acidobacteria bacterium]|nr:hypothetical protein [Acidobacteriota bacterium]